MNTLARVFLLDIWSLSLLFTCCRTVPRWLGVYIFHRGPAKCAVPKLNDIVLVAKQLGILGLA